MEKAPLPEDEAQSLDALRLNQALAAQRAVDEKLRQTLAELKQQYRAAEHARSETRAIIDATSEAIILISPSGYILSVDKQFLEFFALQESDPKIVKGWLKAIAAETSEEVSLE